MGLKYLALGFLIIAFGVVNAQNYDSFFGNNETHIIQLNNNYTLGQFPLSLDSIAITSEVTNTANMVLKKAEHFEYYNQTSPSTIFYLREDTSEGKLWMRFSPDGNEFLLIDMSLDVGDTTNIFDSYNTHTVTDVEYINGKKHIIFDNQYLLNFLPGVSNTEDRLFFREGVIPVMIAEPIAQQLQVYFISGESFTVCVTKDGGEAFFIDNQWDINLSPYSPNWVSCEFIDIYNLSNENFIKPEFTIFPNPADDELHIKSNQTTIQDFEIFDLNGKRLMQSGFNDRQPINIKKLPQGLYFIKIQSINGIITTKFIKK